MATSSSVATTCSGSMLTSKGVAQGREELHEALRARSLVGRRITVNDIVGHDLVDDVQVATDNALCEPLLSCDIVLTRHISSLPFLAAGLFIRRVYSSVTVYHALCIPVSTLVELVVGVGHPEEAG